MNTEFKGAEFILNRNICNNVDAFIDTFVLSFTETTLKIIGIFSIKNDPGLTNGLD